MNSRPFDPQSNALTRLRYIPTCRKLSATYQYTTFLRKVKLSLFRFCKIDPFVDRKKKTHRSKKGEFRLTKKGGLVIEKDDDSMQHSKGWCCLASIRPYSTNACKNQLSLLKKKNGRHCQKSEASFFSTDLSPFLRMEPMGYSAFFGASRTFGSSIEKWHDVLFFCNIL